MLTQLSRWSASFQVNRKSAQKVFARYAPKPQGSPASRGLNRTRMSWDWVGDTPVFVYTTFLDHFKFNVRIVLGKRGDQNDPDTDTSPSATPWMEYINEGQASKDEVVQIALTKALFGGID